MLSDDEIKKQIQDFYKAGGWQIDVTSDLDVTVAKHFYQQGQRDKEAEWPERELKVRRELARELDGLSEGGFVSEWLREKGLL